MARAIRLVPGVLLLFVIGYAGKFTEQSIAAYGRAHHVALPNIEYVLWAIAFGLIVANTVGVKAAAILTDVKSDYSQGLGHFFIAIDTR